MTVVGRTTSPSKAPGHLLRVLGLSFTIAVAVGTMIGGGILRTPGSVLDQVPVAWLALALWAFAGIHALLGANVVAEAMTSVPKSGGLFNVARAAFGEFGALLVGWTDWLLGMAAMASLSIASGEFLALVAPQLAPHVVPVSVAVAAALFGLNWIGVREGRAIQLGTSAAKGFLLLALVVVIFVWRPSVAPGEAAASVASPITFFGIIVAYQLVTGAYSGWHSAGYFAEEDRDPGRNIPRGLFTSILAVMAIYLLMNAALLYALPVDRLRSAELPVSLAISDIFGPLSVAVVAVIATVSVVGCLNANIMTTSRVFHALASDRFVPAAAARVNNGGTPDVALGLTATGTILLVLTGEFETVFLIMGALGVFMLALTDAAFFKLRISQPDLPRPYRAIGYPWLPGLVLILDFGILIAFLAADPVSGLFMALGIAACVPLSLIARHRRKRLASAA